MTEFDDTIVDAWDEQHSFVRPTPHWSDWTKVLARPWRMRSPKASAEWMGYYQHLYRDQGPSPQMFKRLLARNGLWNITNPYFDGNPDFYKYCQDGVALADVDFVLGRWQDRIAQRSTYHPPLKPLKQKNPVQKDIADISNDWNVLFRHRPHQLGGQSVAATEENNRIEWLQQQNRWEIDAHRCLTILFQSHQRNWIWMQEVLHKDNIRLLCKVVYDGAPTNDRGSLLKQWKAAGWVTDVSEKMFKNVQ